MSVLSALKTGHAEVCSALARDVPFRNWIQMTHADVKDNLLSWFSPKEKEGLKELKRQIIRQYVNLGIDRSERELLDFNPSEAKIRESIAGKNMLVMCGGGKDSEVVLAGARVLQLMVLQEYGVTFELRVGIGRQPGMIDVHDNLENAFNALGLKGDPMVDLFYIDGKTTVPYQKDLPLPEHVIRMNRDNALMNGHLFSGAGRRLFCDDCNKNLAGWIATALAYKGGADLYMTGDSQKELLAQIGTAIPYMAQHLGVELEKADGSISVRKAFEMLDKVGRAHSLIVHHTPEAVEARSIDYAPIPEHARFISFFSKVPYESRDRLAFLTGFLGFSFDSLMFSFTESDCGNPVLMCHLYGLIAEHCYGRDGFTYSDGIRMYMQYAVGKMEEKGFPAQLIQQMKDRYASENHIQAMRITVEEYARRAYGFEPEHLIAMVYAPFTENGKNLKPWLDYLARSNNIQGIVSGQPIGHDRLWLAKTRIREMLVSGRNLSISQQPLAERLQELTGMDIQQMRHLCGMGLALNNFDPGNKGNETIRRFRETMEQADTLYTGEGILQAAAHPVRSPVKMTIMGR